MTANQSKKRNLPKLSQSCATCVHAFGLQQADPPQGFCRRYPPILKLDGVSGAFPPVRLDWRCGEWSAAK